MTQGSKGTSQEEGLLQEHVEGVNDCDESRQPNQSYGSIGRENMMENGGAIHKMKGASSGETFIDDDDNDDDDYAPSGLRAAAYKMEGREEQEVAQDEELLVQSKVAKFSLTSDPNQNHRGKELRIFSFARPHMRGFHGAWMCHFASFFILFSFAPLLPQVQKSLGLSKADIWLTNILNVTTTVAMRFLLGPFCDKYGARTMMTGLLAICSIPCYVSGTVSNLTQLAIIRSLIGCVGGTFVTCQFWTACMFTKEVGGTAMALTGGWANTGAGVTQIVMGTVLFPMLKDTFHLGPDLAWRVSFVFPATFALATAAYFYKNSDDSPLGNFADLKKAGLMKERSASDSFRSGVLNLNSWILFLQYGASFGVELTMENGAAMYYHDQFGQSVESAAALAGIFGLTNLYGRYLGGFLSDCMNKKMSLRGRLWAQMGILWCEGCLVLVFGRCQTLKTAIVAMIAFSTLTQMCMGTCFAIVPYVDGPNTGSISGIVGAGGNCGAILLGSVFRHNTYEYSFTYMGTMACIMSLLTPFIIIKGYRGICFGNEATDKTKMKLPTLLVPS